MRYILIALLALTTACISEPLPADLFTPADAEKPQTVPASTGQACSSCQTDNDCNAGLSCDAKAGLCRAPGQKALSCISECLARPECFDSGWCTPTSEGKCIADSDADCATSASCEKFGHCHLVYGSNGASCGATSQADCDQSERCQNSEFGCTFEVGCKLN
jgi:hypothetical protein